VTEEGFIPFKLFLALVKSGAPAPELEWYEVNGVLTPYTMDMEKIKTMSQTFKGSTDGRLSDKCPILGAKFWKAGVKVTGKVIRKFPTANGDCYEIGLFGSLKIKGNVCSPEEKEEITVKRVAVGAMKGFGMALANASIDELKNGDEITIVCKGAQKYKDQESPMVMFEIDVVRP
jgi:hypothetical protein